MIFSIVSFSITVDAQNANDRYVTTVVKCKIGTVIVKHIPANKSEKSKVYKLKKVKGFNTYAETPRLTGITQIATTSSSVASIQLWIPGRNDSIAILMKPSTSLNILSPEKLDSFLLNLDSGSVKVKATMAKNNNGKFRVKTPLVVAGVRGTEYEISYDPNGKAYNGSNKDSVYEKNNIPFNISVTEGSIEISGADNTIIPKNFILEANKTDRNCLSVFQGIGDKKYKLYVGSETIELKEGKIEETKIDESFKTPEEYYSTKDNEIKKTEEVKTDNSKTQEEIDRSKFKPVKDIIKD